MIRIQELRIGNYILVDDIVRQVCSLQSDENSEQDNCVGFVHNDEFHYERCDTDRIVPVEVSDKILVEMGFKFDTYFKHWQRSRPEKSYTIELDTDYWATDFANKPIRRNLNQLHLLQNLFFFIQGEELFFQDYSSTGARNKKEKHAEEV